MKRHSVFRTLALILALALALTAFAGCGASGEKPGESTQGGVEVPSEKDELSPEALYEAAAAKQADNPHPIAVFVLGSGETVTAELYEDVAPNTVNNFISLANSGFYDGLIFHRVIADFMIQGGDPDGNGTGGPGYQIPGEFSNNGFKNDLAHTPGVLSMARQGSRTNPASKYNTAGSQFFICVATYPSLDGDYAAFGKVIDGMDAVYAISNTATDANDKPLTDQVMKYVRVDTHGVPYDPPVKTGDGSVPA